MTGHGHGHDNRGHDRQIIAQTMTAAMTGHDRSWPVMAALMTGHDQS